MGLKNLFTNSSNDMLNQNMDLLEDHDLVNIFGSPNKLFLKFLNSRNIDIANDEITEDLIGEFEDSLDSIEVKVSRIRQQKEIIVRDRKVWINIPDNDGVIECDLELHHDCITIEKTGLEIPYSDMGEITMDDGGWSKKKITIATDDGDFVFEINENKAVALKEILEDNIENQDYDEVDALLELYSLFDEGKISAEELEARKAILYSDDRYCTNCGTKVDSDCLFCPECGMELIE